MKTAEDKLEYLKVLSKQMERYQNREIVGYGSDEERFDYVWRDRLTSDALAACRVLVLLATYGGRDE